MTTTNLLTNDEQPHKDNDYKISHLNDNDNNEKDRSIHSFETNINSAVTDYSMQYKSILRKSKRSTSKTLNRLAADKKKAVRVFTISYVFVAIALIAYLIYYLIFYFDSSRNSQQTIVYSTIDKMSLPVIVVECDNYTLQYFYDFEVILHDSKTDEYEYIVFDFSDSIFANTSTAIDNATYEIINLNSTSTYISDSNLTQSEIIEELYFDKIDIFENKFVIIYNIFNNYGDKLALLIPPNKFDCNYFNITRESIKNAKHYDNLCINNDNNINILSDESIQIGFDLLSEQTAVLFGNDSVMDFLYTGATRFGFFWTVINKDLLIDNKNSKINVDNTELFENTEQITFASYNKYQITKYIDKNEQKNWIFNSDNTITKTYYNLRNTYYFSNMWYYYNNYAGIINNSYYYYIVYLNPFIIYLEEDGKESIYITSKTLYLTDILSGLGGTYSLFIAIVTPICIYLIYGFKFGNLLKFGGYAPHQTLDDKTVKQMNVFLAEKQIVTQKVMEQLLEKQKLALKNHFDKQLNQIKQELHSVQ